MSSALTRIRMTDVSVWPDAVKPYAFALPVLSVPVARHDETGALKVASELPEIAPQDLLPKLTVKSWQETGRLRIIPAGLPLAPAIAARLATPSAQQLAVLQAWDEAEDPPLLHLFPFTDMRLGSELRCLWADGALTVISACRRGTARERGEDLDALGQLVARAMPSLGTFVLQCAVPSDGVPRIMDINPGLTPPELASLKRDAA